MARNDRLMGASALLLRILRLLNYALFAAAVIALLGSVLFTEPLIAQLTRKYRGIVDIDLVITFLRVMIVIGLASCVPLDRLLASLQAILKTVQIGDPFTRANAQRVQTIGWSLLTLQLIDLLIGAAIWWARTHHIQVVDWQPTLLGWLGVLFAFILARVFMIGTALREDVEGTI
jgi:hypothetical protein